VLAAAGIGTFFDGVDANTLAVHGSILAEPRLIAAASAGGAPGDGSNAGRIAALATAASELLGGRSVVDFHDQMTHDLAVVTAAAENDSAAAGAVFSSLQAQRESVSGVNLDEEAISLTVYERAFQGASRYLTVVDSMTQELLTMVS
jgi:flagellar hook-associated protein 1 FlgK